MRKSVFAATLALLTISSASHSRETSPGAMYGLSSAIVSIGGSALVSGIILSPVLLPISLVMTSVEKNQTQKTAVLTAVTPDRKEIKMAVPLAVAEEGKLKKGDALILDKTPDGTGAYLKKDGKVLSHMVNQGDSSLSENHPLPAK